VDSVRASAKGYERYVHPALVGLVPQWNGGALWRGPSAVANLAPALTPRPPACARAAPQYYACTRRLQAWREDSIYHVNVLCRANADRPGLRRPADCVVFAPDSMVVVLQRRGSSRAGLRSAL